MFVILGVGRTAPPVHSGGQPSAYSCDQSVTEDLPTVDIPAAMARAHDLLDLGFVVGDGNQVLYANDATARIVGRGVDEIIAQGSLRNFFDPEEQERIQEIRRQALETGRPMPERFTTVLNRPDGSALPVELWVKAEITDVGVRTYTFIHDIQERYTVRQELAALAMRDALTDLPNRFVIDEVLDAAIRAVARTEGGGLLLFIDLDGFKEVNDTHGHSAGDAVLLTTADRLRAAVRGSDTPGRLGGDEFVVICPDVTDADLSVLVDRVEASLNQPMDFDGLVLDVQASVGAVRFNDPNESASNVLSRADAAMYGKKELRRSR